MAPSQQVIGTQGGHHGSGHGSLDIWTSAVIRAPTPRRATSSSLWS
jgi:hypothetical protein